MCVVSLWAASDTAVFYEFNVSMALDGSGPFVLAKARYFCMMGNESNLTGLWAPGCPPACRSCVTMTIGQNTNVTEFNQSW